MIKAAVGDKSALRRCATPTAMPCKAKKTSAASNSAKVLLHPRSRVESRSGKRPVNFL